MKFSALPPDWLRTGCNRTALVFLQGVTSEQKGTCKGTDSPHLSDGLIFPLPTVDLAGFHPSLSSSPSLICPGIRGFKRHCSMSSLLIMPNELPTGTQSRSWWKLISLWQQAYSSSSLKAEGTTSYSHTWKQKIRKWAHTRLTQLAKHPTSPSRRK